MASQWWTRLWLTPSTTTAHYSPITSGLASTTSTTVSSGAAPTAAAGTMKAIKVHLTAAPNTGKSRQFQVVVNGTPSALDVTISNAATSGSLTTDVALVAGDRVELLQTPSGTPDACNAQIDVEFEPTAANQFSYPAHMGGAGNNVTSATIPAYSPLLFGHHTSNLSGNDVGSCNVAPFAGTIRSLYVFLLVAPGAGDSWDFIIDKNGSEEATSAVNIADTDTTGNATSLAIAVAAGDQLFFKVKAANGTPASTRLGYAVVFEPSTAGRWCWGVSAAADPDAATRFHGILGTTNVVNDTTEGVLSPQMYSPFAGRIVSFYGAITTAPSAGDGWTFTTRIGASDGSHSFAITDAETADGDGTGQDAVAVDDLINITTTVTGTPDASTAMAWSVGFGPAPGGGGGGGGGKGGGGGQGGNGGGNGGGGPPGNGGGGPPGQNRRMALVGQRKRRRRHLVAF